LGKSHVLSVIVQVEHDFLIYKKSKKQGGKRMSNVIDLNEKRLEKGLLPADDLAELYTEQLQRMADGFFKHIGNQEQSLFVLEHQETWREIGGYFKEQREAYGLTEYQVAKHLGVSTGRIKRFEAGEPVQDARLLESAYRLLFLSIKR
jgi:ribosome-binding protein aMBF1 (putative translation factor)